MPESALVQPGNVESETLEFWLPQPRSISHPSIHLAAPRTFSLQHPHGAANHSPGLQEAGKRQAPETAWELGKPNFQAAGTDAPREAWR